MFKETDQLITRLSENDERRARETNQQSKETDKKLRKLENLFTSQWGKLIESLVKGDLVPLLRGKGIAVERTLERVSGRYGNQDYEFDIIAENGQEVVIVEVKTTLYPKHIKDFLRELNQVKTWIRHYGDKRVLGAVAYLRAESESEKMAEKRGLFVIRATGNSASIINGKYFQPKAF